jgi:hypothetical protein
LRSLKPGARKSDIGRIPRATEFLCSSEIQRRAEAEITCVPAQSAPMDECLAILRLLENTFLSENWRSSASHRGLGDSGHRTIVGHFGRGSPPLLLLATIQC